MKIAIHLTRFLPKQILVAYRVRRYARSAFTRLSRRSQVFVPTSLPLHVRLYFLFVAQLIHDASVDRKLSQKIYIGLPKHLKALPRSWSTLVLQVEQAIYTAAPDQLSSEGRIEHDADPAIEEVVRAVRLHGPLESFEKASAVIDYSALNIERLANLPALSPHSPTLHTIAPVLGDFPHNVEPRKVATVATMYGSPDRGRRGRMRSVLSKAGIEVHNIHNFENYKIAFRHVAILLNFRQVEHFSTPEELRILPALLQGVVVITEDTPFARKSLCAEYLLFAHASNLIEIVKEVQGDYSKYWAQAFGDDRFSNFVKDLELSNNATATRIVQRINSNKSVS